MKVTDFKKELKQLSSSDVHEYLEALRKELFSLKLNSYTSHVKDYSLFKKLRKNIARALTHKNAVEKTK